MGSIRSRLLAALVAAGLLFAACGDDDDAAVDADAAADLDTDEVEDALEDEAEDAIGAQLGGECAFLGEFAGAGIGDAVDPSAFLTPGGTTDFGAFFAPLAEEFAEVAGAAPDEIRADFEMLADAFGDIAAELDGVTLDFSDPENVDPEVLAKLESLGETFENEEFEQAANNIDAWVNENCSG